MSSMTDPCTGILAVYTLENLITEIEETHDLILDLQLDVTRLDYSWIEQPALSFKWNRLGNMAEYCHKKEERSCKDLMAQKYLSIREGHLEAGEKCTEALLANEVALHPEVIAAHENVTLAAHIVNVMKSGIKAIDDKRRALEGLVTLVNTQYFTSGQDNPVLAELGANKVVDVHKTALNENKRLRNLKKKGEKA